MKSLCKFLAVILLVALVGAAAITGGPQNGFERAVMQRMAELRGEWPRLSQAASGLTLLGGAYVTLGLAAAASIWLLFRRAPWQALLIAVTVVGERLLVDQLKWWVGRPRPLVELDWLPASLAYPSGHAANSMTAFLSVALVAMPPKLRRTAAVAAVMLSILVGLTRVVLGVHWPSDVIGGWALGLLAVAAAVTVGKASGAIGPEQQHQIVGRHRPALGEDEAA